MTVAEGLLNGTGALLVIAALIALALVLVIAWDAVGTILTPMGLAVLPIVIAVWFLGAMVIGLPANVVLGHDPPGRIWAGLVAAPIVALVLGRRFRTVTGNTPARVLTRAGVLLLGCGLAKCLAFASGFPVFQFWIGGAVTFGALVVCVAAWQFVDREGSWHLFVRAAVLLAAAGLVGAWARVNHVPVAGDPKTASSSTVAVMLLAVPLLVLAGVLVAFALGRGMLPGTRTAVRRTGERMPEPRQVWNAFVTFDEYDSEGKDRPVLVLSVDQDSAEVLTITSQDKSRFHDFLFLPRDRCSGVLTKDSWMELQPTQVPLDLFRNFRGLCPPWVWTEVRARGLGVTTVAQMLPHPVRTSSTLGRLFDPRRRRTPRGVDSPTETRFLE